MLNTTIFYTITDEAPALATRSFLPIVESFTKRVGINIAIKDISLASRILAQFSDVLKPSQRHKDTLKELGEIAKTADANIIKLPNISASIPQLKAAIKELQSQGFTIPNYPDDDPDPKAIKIKAKYSKVLGSAVNPVLREGNSDRRVAEPVKQYAQANPHSMGQWNAESKSQIASMLEGDYFSNERSFTLKKDDVVRIELHSEGQIKTLKSDIALLKDEVIDATVMDSAALKSFYAASIRKAKQEDLLLSLHLKATMMKVSDPIMFGHAVDVYFDPVLSKHAKTFEDIGVNTRNGIGDLYNKIEHLNSKLKAKILRELEDCYEQQPDLAMVNSEKGITNLHVPSDIIVDASIPATVRSSGKMWSKQGGLQDTLAMIPDRSYATMYQKVFEYCKKHGAFDVATMGNVSNVGLMAQKAEEYGSHDKTFEISNYGIVKVINSKDEVLLEHKVHKGDLWRMCQTKDLPIRDWVKLAVNRAKATGQPAFFWLDKKRGHDAELIKKVNAYLQDYDTTYLDIRILNPDDAIDETMERISKGENTISVTGNVLRDYLTDLFPILELGTSAKMLSIVPLLAGGGLFETGAGGSAPKHVQQVLEENHLRWDSLGEFLALAVSLEDLAEKTDQKSIQVLADCLNKANSQFLKNDKSPSRKVGELDTRGSHFYLALYWAQALAAQKEDEALRKTFESVSAQLLEQEKEIVSELNSAQGDAADLGGYYLPNDDKANLVMRPSKALNEIIAQI